MSDYHVMEGELNNFQVVFHLPVPDEQNVIGTINVRAALAEDTSVLKTSRLPWIIAGEQTSLTDGSLFEHVEIYSTHESHTQASDQATLDARFTALSTIVANRLRRRYAYWRFERNVP